MQDARWFTREEVVTAVRLSADDPAVWPAGHDKDGAASPRGACVTAVCAVRRSHRAACNGHLALADTRVGQRPPDGGRPSNRHVSPQARSVNDAWFVQECLDLNESCIMYLERFCEAFTRT